MTIDFVIEEKDIVKKVNITTSPIEYLIISAALKQFMENPSNHDSDIEIAKQMRKVIENHGMTNKEFIDKLTKNIPTWKLILIDKWTDFKVWFWLKTHKGVEDGNE